MLANAARTLRAEGRRWEKRAAIPHLPRTLAPQLPGTGTPARGRERSRWGGLGEEPAFPWGTCFREGAVIHRRRKKGKKTNRNFPTESRAQSLCNVKALCKSGGEAQSRNGASSPDTLSFSGAQPSTLWLGFSKQPRDAEAQFLPHCKSLKEFSLSRLTKRR